MQVDLGAQVPLDRVALKLPTGWAGRTQSLAVLASSDGGSFTTLAGPQARAFAPDQANTVNLDLPAATARFVRVQVAANSGWNAAQLSELEIYGEGGGGPADPPLEGTDLARGKPVEATSATQNYLAANANDDNVGTYWESAGLPAALTAKLGADADIEAVVVTLNPDQVWGARRQSFEVQGRAQGASAFTTLKARADYAFGPAANQNSVVVPVTGRAADVRLAFQSNTGAPGAQVAELQVIGKAAPHPDFVVTGLTWSPAAPSERGRGDGGRHRPQRRHRDRPRDHGERQRRGHRRGFRSGRLPPGRLVRHRLRPRRQAAAGSYTVSAAVDPTDTVAELDNGNNSRTAAQKLTVARAPGPDLRVTGITSNPASPAVGSSVSFTVAVDNRGTTTVPAGSVTRLTVGGTTLQGTTGTIAAGPRPPSPSTAPGRPPTAAPS
ncbi:hypothetical protein GCM10020295_03830 [Streptomyces cinereospinus]